MSLGMSVFHADLEQGQVPHRASVFWEKEKAATS